MKKILFLFLLLPSISFAQVAKNNGQNGISVASDNRFVNVIGDTMSGPLTLSGSSLTVTGNSFSVGSSTLVVSGGKVGVGGAIVGAPQSSADLQIYTDNTSGPTIFAKQTSIGDGYRASIQVQNGNGDELDLVRTDRTQTSAYYTGAKTGSSALIGVSASAPIQFATANTMRMFIDKTGTVHTFLQTIAQINALATTYAGGQVTCSDCVAPYTVCMSTGTAAGAFVKLNTTDHCQ